MFQVPTRVLCTEGRGRCASCALGSLGRRDEQKGGEGLRMLGPAPRKGLWGLQDQGPNRPEEPGMCESQMFQRHVLKGDDTLVRWGLGKRKVELNVAHLPGALMWGRIPSPPSSSLLH